MNTSSRAWHLLLATLLLVPLLPARADQQTGSTVRHHRVAETDESPDLQQAEAAMQKQDFATAEPLLQKAVAANPEDYRAWFDLGYVYNATKQTPKAIEAYKKSVAAKPDVFESNLNLGIILARQGDKAEAAKYLQAATQLTPSANADEGRARAWLSLGLVMEASDPQQALSAYTQAAKLNPKDPEPHLSAGLLLEHEKRFDEAVHEYQAAAELDPKATEPIAGLANVYSQQKKFPEAEAQLRKLLSLQPDNGAARAQLGRVLAAEGKQDEAASTLASGDHAADDPHVALELGTTYVKSGNNTAAEEQLRLAVKGLPQDAEAHYALGSVLLAEKKYAEAQQELLAALRLKPDLSEAYGNLAVAAAANKDYNLAIKALDERAKFIPESPATYFLRATSYDNLKNRAKAVENYKQFLAVDNGKLPDQEWQARHRLIAIDPDNASKYSEKK